MAKLFFRYSTMNAGKSLDILSTAHKYKEQGKKPLLFTSAIDDRYGLGKITSRVGLQADATIINSNTNIIQIVNEEKPDAVLVDEAQFLNEHNVEQLSLIAMDYNIPVLCYGLRSDFQGKLFPGSAYLFARAETIEELITECWFSRKKATMNLRVINGQPVFEGEQIVIGNNTNFEESKKKDVVSYLPVSKKVYYQCKRTGELPKILEADE